MNAYLKLFSEVLPIVMFFLLYKFYGIMVATIGAMITTIIANVVAYYNNGTISKVSLVTLVVILVLGGITIFSGDTKFIKMKPTIINFIFFGVLFFGIFQNKGYMRYIFAESFSMEEKNWLILSRRWAFFFLFLGLLNEVIWRNFDDDIWVNFKVFGIVICSFVFLIFNIPFIKQNAKILDEGK